MNNKSLYIPMDQETVVGLWAVEFILELMHDNRVQ